MAGTIKCWDTLLPTVIPTIRLSTLFTKTGVKTTSQSPNKPQAISTLKFVTEGKQSSTESAPNMIIEGVAAALGICCLIGGIVAMVIIVRRKRKNQMPKSPSQDELSAPHSGDFNGPVTSPRSPDDGLVYDYAIVQRQNVWAKLRVRNSGYEIPCDNGEAKPRETNTGYEIPWTEEDNKRSKHMEPNANYETPQDNMLEKHKDPNTGNALLQQNIDYEIPEVSNKTYFNKSKKSANNKYGPVEESQQNKTDTLLYDSDEYVSMC